MLKKIGLILVAMAFSILVFPLFLASTARVERRVNIQSSPATIYAVLIDFQQFSSWSPWVALDPKVTYQVEGQGIGSRYSWVGEKSGRGEMVIQNAQENESIDVQLSFHEPFASEAMTGWKLSDLGNGSTEVLWHFRQDLSYFQRYFGLTMDGMLGTQFEDGLRRLKARLEGQSA